MNWEKLVEQLPFPVEVSPPYAPRGRGAARALLAVVVLGAVAELLFAVTHHNPWYGLVPRVSFGCVGVVVGVVISSGLEWARQHPTRSRLVSVFGPLLAATMTVICFGTVTALGLTYVWEQLNALVVEDWKLVDVVAAYEPIVPHTVFDGDDVYAEEVPEALAGGLLTLKAVQGRSQLLLRVPAQAGEPLDARLLTTAPWPSCPANQHATEDGGAPSTPARIDAP